MPKALLVPLQALRHLLVPATLPQHTARLLRLLLARLQRWPAPGQLELVGELRSLVFEASVGALFGERFLWGDGPEGSASGSNGSSDAGPASAAAAAAAARLQQAFFAFEEGFELAASPVPHLFQPAFLAARRRLVAALRWGAPAFAPRQPPSLAVPAAPRLPRWQPTPSLLPRPAAHAAAWPAPVVLLQAVLPSRALQGNSGRGPHRGEAGARAYPGICLPQGTGSSAAGAARSGVRRPCCALPHPCASPPLPQRAGTQRWLGLHRWQPACAHTL